MKRITPGPWTYEPAEHEDSFAIKGTGSAVWRVADTYGYPMPGQSEANARLIAAAPDLLAACEAAMRIETLWCPRAVEAEHAEELKALAMMRENFKAAIARASTSELCIEFDVVEMSDDKCGMCEAEIPVGKGVQCANCILCDDCGQYAADFACGPAEGSECTEQST